MSKDNWVLRNSPLWGNISPKNTVCVTDLALLVFILPLSMSIDVGFPHFVACEILYILRRWMPENMELNSHLCWECYLLLRIELHSNLSHFAMCSICDKSRPDGILDFMFSTEIRPKFFRFCLVCKVPLWLAASIWLLKLLIYINIKTIQYQIIKSSITLPLWLHNSNSSYQRDMQCLRNCNSVPSLLTAV